MDEIQVTAKLKTEKLEKSWEPAYNIREPGTV